jgi:hypothetical protein
MADSFTPNLHLALQVTGENDGTWGNDLNTNVFSIIDSVLGSALSITVSNADVTLNTAQTQNSIIAIGGSTTANINVIFPPIGRTFFIINFATGSGTVSVKTSAVGAVAQTLSRGVGTFFLINGVNIIRAPDVYGPASATPGNLPMFADASGKDLIDSGTIPPTIASQAQAEAGSSNIVYNTPLRTAQQTTARIASQALAQAGTDNNALMTPLRTSQAIQLQATAFPTASTDPNLLSFPLGTILTATGSLNRNQACNIYLDASDATAYRITSNGGAICDGTWLSRGRIGSSVLAVRIS